MSLKLSFVIAIIVLIIVENNAGKIPRVYRRDTLNEMWEEFLDSQHSSGLRLPRQYPPQGFPQYGFGVPPYGGVPQPQPPKFGVSQSTSNANAHSHGFRPDGFDTADALASGQAFQTNGPSGGFGAGASNALSNTIHGGPGGLGAGFGNSGSQFYNLPNGQKLNIAFTSGLSNGPGGQGASRGSSINFS